LVGITFSRYSTAAGHVENIVSGRQLAPWIAVLAYFETALGWRDVLKRTVHETQADNGLGLAAQLAYYFFLSLFPALLFLLALAGMLPGFDMVGQATAALAGVAPPEVVALVREQLTKVAEGSNSGLLSFGVVAALWSGSSAMVSVIGALDAAYDVEDARPWWKQRLTAILLTLGVAAFIIAAFTLVIGGSQLAEFAAARAGLGPVFEWTWRIVQWPVAFALVALGVGLIYYFAPDVEQDLVWLTPGCVAATLLWLVSSLAFRFYVANFGSYNATYGTIGGVMVLLLWLYLTGLSILVGAEMNAEIEHAAAHSVGAGAPVPGVRKVIGSRAARQFRERQRERIHSIPDVERPRRRAPLNAVGRAGAVVAGLASLFGRRTRE
jgi:membrane protein